MSCSTLIIYFKRKIILICAIDGSKNAAEKCVSVITLTQNTIWILQMILEIFMLVKNSKHADFCINTFLNGWE